MQTNLSGQRLLLVSRSLNLATLNKFFVPQCPLKKSGKIPVNYLLFKTSIVKNYWISSSWAFLELQWDPFSCGDSHFEKIILVGKSQIYVKLNWTKTLQKGGCSPFFGLIFTPLPVTRRGKIHGAFIEDVRKSIEITAKIHRLVHR